MGWSTDLVTVVSGHGAAGTAVSVSSQLDDASIDRVSSDVDLDEVAQRMRGAITRLRQQVQDAVNQQFAAMLPGDGALCQRPLDSGDTSRPTA